MSGPRHQLLLQSQNLWAKSLWRSILYSGFSHQGRRLKALATVDTSEAGLNARISQPQSPSLQHRLPGCIQDSAQSRQASGQIWMCLGFVVVLCLGTSSFMTPRDSPPCLCSVCPSPAPSHSLLAHTALCARSLLQARPRWRCPDSSCRPCIRSRGYGMVLTLELLRKVDDLLAHPTFLASSPAWHCGSCWEAWG